MNLLAGEQLLHFVLLASCINWLTGHSGLADTKKIVLKVGINILVSYMKTVSKSFFPVATGINKEIVFTIPNTLKKYITQGKDNLNYMLQEVYSNIMSRLQRNICRPNKTTIKNQNI